MPEFDVRKLVKKFDVDDVKKSGNSKVTLTITLEVGKKFAEPLAVLGKEWAEVSEDGYVRNEELIGLLLKAGGLFLQMYGAEDPLSEDSRNG
jgi:hypothetical protein